MFMIKKRFLKSIKSKGPNFKTRTVADVKKTLFMYAHYRYSYIITKAIKVMGVYFKEYLRCKSLGIRGYKIT